MKWFFLLLFFACFLMGRPATASDQNLVHGAGTLPHLTSAVTLSIGAEFPAPLIYAVRYDIGLGNRVQLGISASALGVMNALEIHSMFNILKTESESDFLSLYVNPSIFHMDNFIPIPFIGEYSLVFSFLKSGVAYEHRFGAERNIGLYVKIGAFIPIVGVFNGEFSWGARSSALLLDGRVGFQALLDESFSIALEPWMICFYEQDARMFFAGKAALTWAF
jgi:hypothetical protein